MPVTMEQFTQSVKDKSAASAEILLTKWIPECCEIIDDNRDKIEDWMPEDEVAVLCPHKLMMISFI